MKISFLLIPAIILFGCSPQASALSASADLAATTEGSLVSGKALLSETADGLQISINIQNVSPGKHGIHIHENGSCEEAGNAAGGHYNPDAVSHGHVVQNGFSSAHPGDMGNIEAGPDGTGTLTVTIKSLSLNEGKYNVAGKAIILHEKEDDFGQPTGNAGGRIACGIIKAQE